MEDSQGLVEVIATEMIKGNYALNPIIFFTDSVDLTSKTGYVIANPGSMELNGQKYDLAVAQLDHPVDIPGFYNIPILNSHARYVPQIHAVVLERLKRTDSRRCLVHTNLRKAPTLLDFEHGPDPKVFESDYFVTDSDRLSASPDGLLIAEEYEMLRKHLMQRF